MTKHTSGPWSFSREGDYIDVFPVICDYKDNCEGEDADYRLMAAAPDMLAALEQAEVTLGLVGPLDGAARAALDDIRAAIAKAKGAA